MSNKKNLYFSSSEEEDDDDKCIPKMNFPKSAVFNFKSTTGPILEDKYGELDISQG